MFDRPGEAKVFFKLDLKTGFHQIRVTDEDIAKTAFKTRYSQFEYLVMPMGLCSAPTTFQTLMNLVFHDCIDNVLSFIWMTCSFSARQSVSIDDISKPFCLV